MVARSLAALGAGGRTLWRKYEGALARQPYLVQSTTSAVLWAAGDCIAQKVVERRPKLDLHRTFVTSMFGACFIGPVGHWWYSVLDQWAHTAFIPGTAKFVAGKVLADTLVLGPTYVLAFYAWGSYLIDRTGWEGFKTKVSKDFVATFVAQLALWPAFQTFNFYRIPVEHQLLAVNMMTLVDASFLSFARGQDDWVATVMETLKDRQEAAQKKTRTKKQEL